MDDSQTVYIGSEDPDSLDARILCDERSAYHAALTGESGQQCVADDDLRSIRARYVVARNAMGEAMGCGAIRRQSYHAAELMRLYVRPQYRGLEAIILSYLEEEARLLGYHTVCVVTTPGESNASRFCEASGYRRTPADERGAVCFEKTLLDSV
ncbi:MULTISPECIES: GNAT family N-acetyltransferase [Caballeronia]|jgi:N-acetylglutamate synthase-like GNAT family acetyltransferase|uniref:Acetyltransferase n=1 Tax=Caballeronia zhejiangensis TaxID=871203 RepID=A0A656QGV2_9BURK|nr:MULTISPECIES: GNAT family N-acetyltransferase [Caballeronia]EKS71559.1 GCN5-related N-acetyltransferase [Burkholderia sp. SJ98]KDR26422.1 acetyltransferase [Caballeronia zhejiangensis]MCG7403354.1 GNAT family N-acetyltransferase [Caballeronia zhejiangensis]MCI1044835.1 GNAT family N-acetyltransferase [Caballeronia zhejiangensis]MDR5769583.1 GNAT family N-acetyltransferase [Caballeronia sp. LZ028]